MQPSAYAALSCRRGKLLLINRDDGVGPCRCAQLCIFAWSSNDIVYRAQFERKLWLSSLRMWSTGTSRLFERIVTIVQPAVPIEARRKSEDWSFIISCRKQWTSSTDGVERCCRSKCKSGRKSTLLSLLRRSSQKAAVRTRDNTCHRLLTVHVYRKWNANLQSPARS